MSAARPSVVFSPETRDQLTDLELPIAAAGMPQTTERYVDAIITFREQLERLLEAISTEAAQ